MPISVFFPAFNEEKRIEVALKNIQWCDQIVVLDKNSTDATREIAKAWNAEVSVMPNTPGYNTKELQVMLDLCRNEWIFIFTASDVMHPDLAKQLKNYTENSGFEYDVIHLPYRRYILGLETKRSPWYSETAPMLFRKSVAKINTEGVHDALHFDSKRHLKMEASGAAV